MINAYKDFWKRSFTFLGTSTRSQYWWATLANLVIVMILLFATIIYGDTSTIGKIFNSLSNLYAIAISAIALSIRRLRDAGYAPQWLLSQFIIIIVLLSKNSKKQMEIYG
ncbi:DUF805 domain-containing protein [Lactococcus garvieae]|uniref:DUF805 domain-containing protein n=1 Tax=Lactococcus garvieae TaxID=1363 RepID=UPI00254CDB84|nr:DUF805 domain-containing protein [Lactococcus garvieae]